MSTLFGIYETTFLKNIGNVEKILQDEITPNARNGEIREFLSEATQ